MSEAREWTFGGHRLWIEAPDLVLLEMHGSFDLPSMEAFLLLAHDLGDRIGPFVLLSDMRDVQGVPAAARKRMTQVEQAYPYRACAVFGASFAIGIVVTMAYKAGRMLAPSAFPFPFAVFVKEAQARAWVAQFRDPPRAGAGQVNGNE